MHHHAHRAHLIGPVAGLIADLTAVVAKAGTANRSKAAILAAQHAAIGARICTAKANRTIGKISITAAAYQLLFLMALLILT
ncbi:MAG: hypothetical protein KGI99_16060 [Bradyrhizobium sp.]|nr:hypothetical protein [Pseudomonadota bacterium]MDE2068677.1 hypothetical protein [Bradyrhizobium sp.]